LGSSPTLLKAPPIDMSHFKQHIIYKIDRTLIQPRYFVLKRRILNDEL
jgi:hypothetical protein